MKNEQMVGELSPKKRKFKFAWPAWTLSRKLMGGSCLLVILTLVLAVTMVLRLNLRLQSLRTESRLRDVAQMVAEDPQTVRALKVGRCSPRLTRELDRIVSGLRDIDVITIAGMDEKRLYHVNRSLIGKTLIGGDGAAAFRGCTYLSRAVGTLGDQQRFFMPVIDPADGRQLGIVLAGSLISNIKSQRRAIYVAHLGVSVIALSIALWMAWVVARSIKRSLLGYEPTQMSRVFLERGGVMNSLEEGLVAVDAEGRIYMTNKAAGEMLGFEEDEINGQVLDVIYPQVRISETLHSGKNFYNRGMTLGNVNILCDRIPMKNDDGTVIGAVAILRNRTEITRMAEELTGVNHMVDALRSNTHEFMNKLHVILGLLRIDAKDEAEQYIAEISQAHTGVIGPVLRKVKNKTLGALILGKMSHCRELDIVFELESTSSVPVYSSVLSADAFVTLVGNLVENAIEAVNAKKKGDGDRMVSLFVHEDDRALVVRVDDTGEGMTSEEVEYVRTQGDYSTKGRHRGTGMKLIQSILATNGGDMQIDSEKGVGTSITVCFSRRKNRD